MNLCEDFEQALKFPARIASPFLTSLLTKNTQIPSGIFNIVLSGINYKLLYLLNESTMSANQKQLDSLRHNNDVSFTGCLEACSSWLPIGDMGSAHNQRRLCNTQSENDAVANGEKYNYTVSLGARICHHRHGEMDEYDQQSLLDGAIRCSISVSPYHISPSITPSTAAEPKLAELAPSVFLPFCNSVCLQHSSYGMSSNSRFQFVKANSNLISTTSKAISSILENSTSPKLRNAFKNLTREFHPLFTSISGSQVASRALEPRSLIDCLLWTVLQRHCYNIDPARQLSPIQIHRSTNDHGVLHNSTSSLCFKLDMDSMMAEDTEFCDQQSSILITDEDDHLPFHDNESLISSNSEHSSILFNILSSPHSLELNNMRDIPPHLPEDEGWPGSESAETGHQSAIQQEFFGDILTGDGTPPVNFDSSLGEAPYLPHVTVDECRSLLLLGDESDFVDVDFGIYQTTDDLVWQYDEGETNFIGQSDECMLLC